MHRIESLQVFTTGYCWLKRPNTWHRLFSGFYGPGLAWPRPRPSLRFGGLADVHVHSSPLLNPSIHILQSSPVLFTGTRNCVGLNIFFFFSFLIGPEYFLSTRRGVDLVLRSKSRYHIDMEVSETGGGSWRFTGVYGEARTEMKYKTWEMLEHLGNQQVQSQPWLCSGDFNEIFFQHEKVGGAVRPQSCLDRFKGALEAYDLQDLGFAGDVFTWRNKQTKGDTHIRKRLDRAVANMEWRVKFPFFPRKKWPTLVSLV